MPTWMVTGGSGFLGRHLLDALVGLDIDTRIVAIGRRCPASWASESFVRADLDDLGGLTRVVDDLAPDLVFHLAGQTPPADPVRLYRGNTRTTVHLLDAIRAGGRPTRVVLAGSAAELGRVAVDDLPVGEDHPCRPLDAYGLSKWFATAFGRLAGPPLEVVMARIFNPIGPGLPRGQAFGRFAAMLATLGPDPVRLTVGDLDARRDFIDARDVADALIALARSGEPGRVYHVGTGRSHRIGDGLDRLIGLSGRSVEVLVHPDLASRGPSDSRADIRRLTGQTGWTPRIPWERSLADLWREKTGRWMADAG